MASRLPRMAIAAMFFVLCYVSLRWAVSPSAGLNLPDVVRAGSLARGSVSHLEILVKNPNLTPITILGTKTCCGVRCQARFPVQVARLSRINIPVELTVSTHAEVGAVLNWSFAVVTKEAGVSEAASIKADVNDEQVQLPDLEPIPTEHRDELEQG